MGVQGAVLAGGRSTRMGRNKGDILLPRGVSMTVNAACLLRRSTGSEVLISGPGGVPDLRSGVGPLGGMEAALYAAKGSGVLFLPCDMPFVSESILGGLLRSFAEDTRRPSVAVSPHLEPLLAVVPVSHREKLSNAVDAGHLKVGRLWMDLGFVPVMVQAPERLADVDFPWEVPA